MASAATKRRRTNDMMRNIKPIVSDALYVLCANCDYEAAKHPHDRPDSANPGWT
jgi:hypothetical protein